VGLARPELAATVLTGLGLTGPGLTGQELAAIVLTGLGLAGLDLPGPELIDAGLADANLIALARNQGLPAEPNRPRQGPTPIDRN
jgi:hypothetical protein